MRAGRAPGPADVVEPVAALPARRRARDPLGHPDRALRRPERPAGDGFTLGFTGKGTEFYVATGNSVRFPQAADPSRFETYDFAEDL
ncbi:hypothetical protein [Streptomyces sp. NPDC054842]